MSVAEQLSEALQRKLEHQQALAKELAKMDEELAVAALATFENPVGAAQWLIRVLPILGAADLTPMELSRTSAGKSACL